MFRQAPSVYPNLHPHYRPPAFRPPHSHLPGGVVRPPSFRPPIGQPHRPGFNYTNLDYTQINVPGRMKRW